MDFSPRGLPIRDVLAIGRKLLQLSRRSKQRARRDMTYDQHIKQTVVNKCAGSGMETAARLTPVPDNRHRAAASNFAVRKGEPSMILMNVHRQNCTHHG